MTLTQGALSEPCRNSRHAGHCHWRLQSLYWKHQPSPSCGTLDSFRWRIHLVQMNLCLKFVHNWKEAGWDHGIVALPAFQNMERLMHESAAEQLLWSLEGAACARNRAFFNLHQSRGTTRGLYVGGRVKHLPLCYGFHHWCSQLGKD